jgi:D-alanine transaminase
MTRPIHIGGVMVPAGEARIPVMDRGFLFGDGADEVTTVIGGAFIDDGPHLARLSWPKPCRAEIKSRAADVR